MVCQLIPQLETVSVFDIISCTEQTTNRQVDCADAAGVPRRRTTDNAETALLTAMPAG